jgi:DNA-binding transcriptional ArsR family regulator
VSRRDGDVVEVFAALGDRTRQDLLDLLARGEGSSSAALAEPLGVSRQAVEKHLRLLEQVGLVTARRDGRRVAWAVRPETVRRSAQWLEARGAEWDRQLALVKAAAEKADGA